MDHISFSVKKLQQNDFNPTLGDVVICRCPNVFSDGSTDGTYKFRPVMVWGGYRDEDGQLIALSVFEFTTQTHNMNSSSLFVTPNDFVIRSGFHDRKSVIKIQHAVTLPVELFDVSRCAIFKIKDYLLPDIISCRANAINANPGNRYCNYQDFGDDPVYYDGVMLNHDLVQPIRSSNNPDVPRPDVEIVDPATPMSCNMSAWLNQMEIDAITRWSVAYMQILISQKIPGNWPEKGTWPNWPDVEWKGECIQCCTEETAMVRDYQPQRRSLIRSP